MPIRRLPLILAALALTCTAAFADAGPTVKGPATPSEAAFVSAMQADLTKRFPTAADAARAGYVRYTNPDDTGAISYANMRWQSADVHHPSQLWYDKSGALLGADYSVLQTGAGRPHVWGIQPGRFYQFSEHVHFVKKNAKTGALAYDNYVMAADFSAAGGNPKAPSAATLVKLHRVASPSDVTTIFDFPAVWDLIVWVVPNPNGAFAEKNPSVKP